MEQEREVPLQAEPQCSPPPYQCVKTARHISLLIYQVKCVIFETSTKNIYFQYFSSQFKCFLEIAVVAVNRTNAPRQPDIAD